MLNCTCFCSVVIYFWRNPKISHFKVYPFTSLVKSYFLVDSKRRVSGFMEKPFYECFIIIAKKRNIPSQVRSPTRLLNIVHADAYTTSIGWIVLARAQHVRQTVLFVRKIQQYLLLTTSGNGPISPKKSVSKVLLTISILMDQTTTSPFQCSILHFRSHSNVPMQSLARVELIQIAIKDIKGICVQPALKASIFASTLV